MPNYDHHDTITIRDIPILSVSEISLLLGKELKGDNFHVKALLSRQDNKKIIRKIIQQLKA